MDCGLNLPAGDQSITVDGAKMRARLTLGALAKIEEEIGRPIGAIHELLNEQSIKVWAVIAYWMLRAGGARIDRECFLEMMIDPIDVGQAFGKALRQFSPDAPGGKQTPIRP